MKLTVLVDNNTYIDQYYAGEPAVSYYIETDDIKILFDTGYSDIFIKNACSMGIDLDSLTHIVLSHGHNDHSRGLKYLRHHYDLPDIRLIAHPLCFPFSSPKTAFFSAGYPICMTLKNAAPSVQPQQTVRKQRISARMIPPWYAGQTKGFSSSPAALTAESAISRTMHAVSAGNRGLQAS